MMALDFLSEQDKAHYFDVVFRDWLGDGSGSSYAVIIDILRGKSYSEVSDMYGVSRSTAHRWVVAAKMKIRRVGLCVPGESHTTQPDTLTA